jgi:AmmeMemoRadiSam system protein A
MNLIVGEKMRPKLNKQERKQLLSIARQTITAYLEIGKLPEITTINEALQVTCGCFVSLKHNGSLRGCIGNFVGDRPLYRLIQEMAIAAATKDPRFYPITTAELALLTIELSVLSPLRQISSIDEITIGEHGIYIEKNINRGVLLPQVATEYKWDRETFLQQTCLKAGLKEDAWKDNVTISIFSAEVFSEAEVKS